VRPAFAITVLRFVPASPQAAFDKDLAAFLAMLGADFTQTGKGYYRMPLDPLLLVAVLVLKGLIGGD